MVYSMNTPVVLLQTETSPRAMKKKSSKSGGAKKAIGDLLSEKFGLLFLGAGGHVCISGMRNLLAFGVEKPLFEMSRLSISAASTLDGLSSSTA